MKNFIIKKRKIIIIVILILLVLLFGCILIFSKSGNFEYRIKDIRMCKGSSECTTSDPQYFYFLNYPTDIPEVKEEIKKINDMTENYYKQVKNSDVSSSECSSVKDTFIHSLSLDPTFSKAIDDKYICVSAILQLNNLCTGKVEDIKTYVFIYDLKQKKMLTQEEYLKKEKIEEAHIVDAIQFTLDYYNEIEGTDFKASDATDLYYYYGNDARSYVAFYHPELNRYDTGLLEN